MNSDVSHIYVIKDAAGFIKVGHARDVSGRLDMLQVGNAGTLTLVFAIRVPAKQVLAVEQMIHRRLADVHVRGEWFKTTDARASMTVQMVAKQLTGDNWKQSDDHDLEQLRRNLRLAKGFALRLASIRMERDGDAQLSHRSRRDLSGFTVADWGHR